MKFKPDRVPDTLIISEQTQTQATDDSPKYSQAHEARMVQGRAVGGPAYHGRRLRIQLFILAGCQSRPKTARSVKVNCFHRDTVGRRCSTS
jgi:hypothetical protein